MLAREAKLRGINANMNGDFAQGSKNITSFVNFRHIYILQNENSQPSSLPAFPFRSECSNKALSNICRNLNQDERRPTSICINNHNYNKILESDWFLARPIFYQIGARAAKVSKNKVSNNKVSNNKVSNNKVSNNKVSNNKVSNNKVRVLRMHALFIWFFVVTKYSLIFLKPSASRMAFLP